MNAELIHQLYSRSRDHSDCRAMLRHSGSESAASERAGGVGGVEGGTNVIGQTPRAAGFQKPSRAAGAFSRAVISQKKWNVDQARACVFMGAGGGGHGETSPV